MKKILMDEYSDDVYNELEQQAEYILSFIDDSQSDLEKFLTIYMILGSSIYYDKYLDERGDIRASNWDGNQNLEGALLEGVTVCAGFSKALCYLLNKVGIECKFVAGKCNSEDSEDHAWNLVKINNKWYYCDLTFDTDAIKEQSITDYCLIGKKNPKFANRELEEELNYDEISDTDFDKEELSFIQEKIKKMLRQKDYKPKFPRQKEREESAHLCTKGVTKQELADYIIAKGYESSDIKKEHLWEEFKALRIKRKYELRKKAKKIEISGTLEQVVEYLMHCKERGIMVYMDFNGHELYSTDFDLTPNSAFLQVLGLTADDYLKFRDELMDADSEEEKRSILKKINELKEINIQSLKKDKEEETNLLAKYYPREQDEKLNSDER